MKNLMFIALTIIVLTQNGFAEVPAKPSVQQYKNLNETLNVLGEIASEGASLAFFGFSEKRRVVKKENCKAASNTEVESYFQEILDIVLSSDSEDRLSSKKLNLAKSEWLKLMSFGPYDVCSESVSGHMSMGDLTIFKSKKHYIEFEFGYED